MNEYKNLNKQQIAEKLVKNTEQPRISAPFFHLEKWRKEKELTSPEIEAYIEQRENWMGLIAFLCMVIGFIIGNSASWRIIDLFAGH